MSLVDEAALRAAIDAGVRAALAALDTPAATEDAWPEWDEFNTDPAPHPRAHVPPEPAQSALRARLLQGTATTTVDYEDDDDDGPIEGIETRGDVIPVSAVMSERGGGFDPRSSEAWMTRQYQKDVVAARRQIPVEDQIKGVGI